MSFIKLQEIVTDGSGLSAITFSNIVPNFKHLHIVGILRTNRPTTASDAVFIRFNGDTGSNYKYMYGAAQLGTGVSTSATSLTSVIKTTGAANAANNFAPVDMFVANYSSTSLTKNMWALSGASDAGAENREAVGSWNSTAAITSISFTPVTGTLITQYSQLTLYGIK